VSARAQVLWASVTTSQRKSATVLVAMDATIKNVNAPNGRKAHYRVQVTVAQQHGRWLVSALNFV
jgi:Mce-associated membrane protein